MNNLNNPNKKTNHQTKKDKIEEIGDLRISWLEENISWKNKLEEKIQLKMEEDLTNKKIKMMMKKAPPFQSNLLNPNSPKKNSI